MGRGALDEGAVGLHQERAEMHGTTLCDYDTERETPDAPAGGKERNTDCDKYGLGLNKNTGRRL